MEPRTLKYVADAMEGELLHGPPDQMCSASRRIRARAERATCFIALAANNLTATHSCRKSLRGAAAVVAERRKLPAGLDSCAVILVDNTRRALGRLGASYRRDFDRPLRPSAAQRQDHDQGADRVGFAPEKGGPVGARREFNNEVGVPLTLLRIERLHQAAVIEAAPIIRGNCARCCR